ncbi:DUF4384 domain-containing protein [Deinococcus lacus]|uniref:DUF4384 domain-containing protein n=1 Tax=Deinococcus lacus TaxID=392561 RepID=A0ABW1YCN5_9DEIO
MKKTPILLLGAAALSLSACTVTTRPNLNLSASSGNLLAGIVSDKGEGSEYEVGEAVRLHVTARTPGYLTLVARQSDGSAQVLMRNVYIEKGTTTFPREGDNVSFNAGLPRGVQKVRAIFTRVRPTTDLVVGGVYADDRWNAVSDQYLRPFEPEDRDVQETYFYIR